MISNTLRSNRSKIAGALVAIAILAGAATFYVTRQPVASRPVIQNLETAPPAARALIKEIAKRSDVACYPAIIGQQLTSKLKVTRHNFQDFDYVAVVSVTDDQKLVRLKVACVSLAGDFLVLTADGWKESGIRQM